VPAPVDAKVYCEVIGEALDGRRAQEHVRALGEFYRSPGSSGYTAAVEYVADALTRAGVEFDRYEAPLDGTEVLGERTPHAWEPGGGTLQVVAPVEETLVSWDDCPSCVPWWCPATPAAGVELELVDVGTGERDEDYAGLDVSGKAVLIHDARENFAWYDIAERAARFGAAGMISNYLLYQYEPWRTRDSVPDAVQQLRLSSRRDDNPWTFTVSQIAFERLRGLLAEGSVRVRFTVDARTYEGRSPYVVARIPGEDGPEGGIAFVAHVTAATKPGANCASGVALMIEMAAEIKRLVDSGEVRRPRRPIIFIFGNEGLASTHWYEHAPEARSLTAAIAFCSVGHDQAATRSSLIMSRSPDSLPTFMNDLLEGLMEQSPKEAPWAYREGSREISLVHSTVLAYTPWSDNATWSKLAVPALLFMSLPDRYFHTQLLTPDKTDPAVFERCGEVNGAAALLAATAGWPEAAGIMREVARRSALRLSRLLSRASELDRDGRGEDAAVVVDEVEWTAARDARAVRSVLGLVTAGDDRGEADALAATLVAELDAIVAEAVAVRDAAPPMAPDFSGGMVPARLNHALPHGIPGLGYDETVALAAEMAAIDPAVGQETLQIVVDELWNLSAGEQTLSEVTRSICHEFSLRLSVAHVHRLAEGLSSAGYLELTSKET
jgi:aminopeptidase YwaD